MDEHDLLNVADAAQALERSTEQVRRYLREGRLKGRRIGGQWFIATADLTAFQTAVQEQTGFLQKLAPAAASDPLGPVIGIGSGGGSNLAEGKEAYRRTFWWRR
ncbi:MAG TPA: helix-turn-helix domain-containing protein [Thermomicrobiales bacterium]|nr:helix-turn-helix domain-containing protein [Thermomicrobiales bacterium]